MNRQLVAISKFLSLVLRHDPGRIGLELDAEGWADIETLLARAEAHDRSISLDQLRQVVEANDKKRFALSRDGLRIRARQGHSIPVNLGLEPRNPPEHLYHGTATRNLDSILEQGLVRGRRQHVHLSLDRHTAVKVGQRHGKPVVLEVAAAEMHGEGHAFFRSENGVWLTEHVPARFLRRL